MENKIIELPAEISIRSLADLVKEQPTTLISHLMKNGVFVSINQNIDFDTAALLIEEFGYTAKEEQKNVGINKNSDSKNAISRPPIVTIMGHVDHGKTSLLDYIRSSNVVAGESGGITQNISAYQINFKTKEGESRRITFIDTPGHEAFSALRAHGASITDIVILVVAADDGVKPQTIEAIQHAKNANVPIVVAINKSDLPGVNPERVKQQLGEHDLMPEEWGGKTVMVNVSAKTGDGIDNLLEVVLLTADLSELKADPDASAEGIVIEGNLDKSVGSVATILVYSGTLKMGQVVVVGSTYGRIRSMQNDLGVKISSALPSTPVQIIGLKDVPKFGDRLIVAPSEKVARTMTANSTNSVANSVSEENVTQNVILKVDVGGSLAALEETLSKLKFKNALITIVSSGIGAVTENDITLAKTSNSVIYSFRTPVSKKNKELAEQEGVELKEEWVIYEIVDDCSERLKKVASPVTVREEIGRLKVLEVFSRKKKSAIIGGEVLDGDAKATEIEIYREKELIGSAKCTAIKIGKVAAELAQKGTQCGLQIEDDGVGIEKGDILHFVVTRVE